MAGALTLTGLAKRFGDTVAVDQPRPRHRRRASSSRCSASSGCGKTTTLRMIAGFEQPDEGAIVLDGRDLSQVSPHRRPVNTVFQSYALFPFLDVADNVAFGLRYQSATKAGGTPPGGAALELVRMEHLADRKPRQLSGGQQQRVALARALVLEPTVLLLDEPMGALDAKLRKQLQVELRALQKAVGTTFVYVTHDQEEALTMSDRLAVLDEGRLMQVGTPSRGLRRTHRTPTSPRSSAPPTCGTPRWSRPTPRARAAGSATSTCGSPARHRDAGRPGDRHGATRAGRGLAPPRGDRTARTC